jgi:hypothetical protein
MLMLALAASPDAAFSAISQLIWWEQVLIAMGFAAASIGFVALANRWGSCLMDIFAFIFALTAIAILLGAL